MFIKGLCTLKVSIIIIMYVCRNAEIGYTFPNFFMIKNPLCIFARTVNQFSIVFINVLPMNCVISFAHILF